MSLFTRCPYCEHGKDVPDDSIGVSAECPKCRQPFVIVPADLPATPESGESREPQHVVADPWSGGKPVAVMPTPVEVRPVPDRTTPLPATAWENGPTAVGPFGLGTWVWVLVGLGAAAAIAAGLSASISNWSSLVIPYAAAGALLGAAALWIVLRRQPTVWKLGLPGVATLGSLVILLAALFAPGLLSPQYEVSRQQSTFDPAAIEAVPVGGELVDPKTLMTPDGADASRAALQQGAVRVRVTGVTVGPLELDTAKPTTTKERYLVVGVQIQHAGHGGPLTFTAWGSNTPTAIPDVRLTRAGKTVGQVDLGTRTARGKLYHEHPLPPSATLTTLLVFEPLTGPPEPLTIELPGEAWGKTGVFRFRIPASMVPAGTKK